MTGPNAPFRYLVSAAALARQLDDPALRIFDCTMKLVPDSETSYRVQDLRAHWARSHIPGAGYLDLQADVSDPESGLRFTLASPGRFADAMERLGIGDENRVVLYSTTDANWATRGWWVMQCMGFDNVAVLDGGLANWIAEGRPVSSAPCVYPQARFTPRPRPYLMCDRAHVEAAIGDPGTLIINGLARERHAGRGGMHYGRPGHIAGSVNVPSRELIDPGSGRFLPAAELRRLFAAAGVTAGREVITYCGGGIAAASVAFALQSIGHDQVRLYDASLQEWAADPQLPMECG